jgi:hypothetical protein
MPTMAVVTPSYAPDRELFADLHASVLAATPASVVHHLVIADCDLEAFAEFKGPRCRIWSMKQLVPSRYVKVPGTYAWVNARRPWPPVRGWVMQQLGKLALAAQLDADVLLMVDSDVLVVRPLTAARFMDGDRPAFYREPGVIDEAMPRHLVWQGVARTLLGLPPAPPPLHDYINALNVWDPFVVRALLTHVERTTGRDWIDATSRQLHFSEDILYGVFRDEVLRSGPADVASPSPCQCYWGTEPLTAGEAIDLACGLAPDDVAVLISSKSHTPLAARRAAWTQLRRQLESA